ncbi:hsp70-like protein [Phyllosticta capitalensis]|uniref:hsp70-like protein n=1 Tax=Phyllosticta capitalensis TaxID=121624 RepID=UPI00312D6FFB
MDKSRLKLIVGVDYGTTYSGISYVVSNETDVDQIEVINQWPGTSDTVCKVPTRIAYAKENPDWKEDKWGFSAGAQSYSWTKLLLDRNTSLTEHDDSALKDFFGTGMMSLPAGKTAKQVCADYLKFLHKYMVQTLCKRFGKDVYDLTPIDFWVTVPAIWSDGAKDATKKAAISAGFGARKSDRINIISEPEAAALTALKPLLSTKDSLDPIKAEDAILVCDCGGGTVDITTYRIVSVQPLQFEELCVGIGGKCGSTSIDRHFNNWMKRTFGLAYTRLPQKRRGPGSPFMNSFEIAKKSFGSSGRFYQNYIEIDCIHMNTGASNHYDAEEGTVKLTWDEMKSFFNPVIKEVIRLIELQIDVAKANEGQVNRIVLVGGFGDSDYLNERISLLKSQLGDGIKLTCPRQPQAAIVQGAALRGLEGLHPSLRIARRHYGIRATHPFRPDVDPESKAFIHRFYGQKYCSERMNWRVRKGQEIESDNQMVVTITITLREDKTQDEFYLYACSTDDAPDYSDDPAADRIGKVVIEFTESDIAKAIWRVNSNTNSEVGALRVEFRINMNSEEGTLNTQAFISGRPAGKATINYREYEAKAPKERAWGKTAQLPERPKPK